MKITLTFASDSYSCDYQLNDEITIKRAIEIISENDNYKIPINTNYVYSKRDKECKSIYLTFKQAKIYSGDVLTPINDGGNINE